MIREIVGPHVAVIDPAPAIAKRVAYVLEKSGRINGYSQNKEQSYATTGDMTLFKHALRALLKIDAEPSMLSWVNNELVLPE